MRLKVCGLKDKEQIRKILKEVKPDFAGFIFYPDSPRYVGEDFGLDDIDFGDTRKVGVFVREDMEQVIAHYQRHELDYVQLHGDESLEYVKELKDRGVKIIKVFRIGPDSKMADTFPFEKYSDLFLFDSRVKGFGGQGLAFDWNKLEQYDGKVPFLLGGGLTLENMLGIGKIKAKGLIGIDVNSGFERAPGDKDLEKLMELKSSMNEIFG